MSNEEAIKYIKSNYPNNQRYEGLCEALDMAINALEYQHKYQWHDLVINKEDTPDKYGYDWVLIQIVEDNGYRWIPKVGEYRASRQDFYCNEANGWIADNNGLFKVVAWKELDWKELNKIGITNEEAIRKFNKMKRQLSEGQNFLPSREELIEMCEIAIKYIKPCCDNECISEGRCNHKEVCLDD